MPVGPALAGIDLSLILTVAGVWLIGACVALALFLPLCIAAKRADESEAQLRAELKVALGQLEEQASQRGRQFFPSGSARVELEDALFETFRESPPRRRRFASRHRRAGLTRH